MAVSHVREHVRVEVEIQLYLRRAKLQQLMWFKNGALEDAVAGTLFG